MFFNLLITHSVVQFGNKVTFIVTDFKVMSIEKHILFSSLKNKLYKVKRNPLLITPDIKSIYAIPLSAFIH